MTEKKNIITSIEPFEDADPLELVNAIGKTPDPAIAPNQADENETLRRPAAHAAFTPHAPAPSSTTIQDAPSFKWVRTVTILSILLWLGFATILAVSTLNISANMANYTALQWAGIAALFIGPLLMIAVASYSFKQLARLSIQAHRLAKVADALTQPDTTVIRRSKTMAMAISGQVDDVNQRLNVALGQLATLEDVLNVQTQSLAQSNIDATQTSDNIASALQQQSSALDSISHTFDERMQALSTMINGHTDNLANATNLAEQKIKEARISVEGATAKINSASDIVRTNTLQATSTLNASHQDINALGEVINERSAELDVVYKKHANDLTGMIEHLRDEQQNLGVILEERLSKMRDLSLSAQASAESLIDASSAGKDTIEALAQSASLADSAVKARFREMQDMVEYSSQHAQSISEKAAQRVRDSLEMTRKEIGRIEGDMSDLQNRIGQPQINSLELVPEEPEKISVTDQTQAKRRWTRLRLKPVQDDVLDVSETEEEDELSIPEQPASPKNTEVDTGKSIRKDIETDQGIYNTKTDTTDASDTASDVFDLHMEPTDITPPTSLPTLDSDTENAIRRTASFDSNPKQKSGFSLKSLFGGGRDAPEDASLSIATSNQTSANTETPTQDDDILEALKKLGLSPNVIVDDGCIIEAANSRVSKGHEAMSKVVGARLLGPVEHMAKALSLDNELSRQSIRFATEFNTSIDALSGNREAIRTQLESQMGRAYLLCDAALNYGRV